MKQHLPIGEAVVDAAIQRVDLAAIGEPDDLRVRRKAQSELDRDARRSRTLAGALQRTSATIPRLRCASLLKPLLFWVAAQDPSFRTSTARWRDLAEPAIVYSANDPTTALWNEVGAETLLREVETRTGIRWAVEPGGRSFGRVLVSAQEVVAAYAALVRAAAGNARAELPSSEPTLEPMDERTHRRGDPAARQVLRWMQRVAHEQSFGLRCVVAQSTGVPAPTVALKCGWFSDTDEHHIRTHAVAVAGWPGDDQDAPAATVAATATITCVLTALPMSQSERATYAESDARGQELPIHERYAGAVLRDDTTVLLSQ